MFGWKRVITAAAAAAFLFTMMPQAAHAAEPADVGADEVQVMAELSTESQDEQDDNESPEQEEKETDPADDRDEDTNAYGSEDGETDTGTEAAVDGGVADSDAEAADTEDGTGADSDAVDGEETNGGAAMAEDSGDSVTDGATAAAADEAEAADPDGAEEAEAGAEDAEATLFSIHGIVEREFVQYGEIDSEALAEQYSDRARRETEAASERGAGSGPAEPSETGKGAGLKGADKVIYDGLRAAVREIAAGERDSGTVRIPIPLKELGLDGGFTAADLGLDYVYDGTLNPELADAVEKIAPACYEEIMECLIADSACEMYPLTGGAEKPAGNALSFYIISGNGNDWDVHLDGYVEISLKPSDSFADPDSGRYAIDSAKIQSMFDASGTASDPAGKDVREDSCGTNREGTDPSGTK